MNTELALKAVHTALYEQFINSPWEEFRDAEYVQGLCQAIDITPEEAWQAAEATTEQMEREYEESDHQQWRGE